jgi:uncharacterized damage-inducible protein DinB
MQMLRDLIQHKWYANARFLGALREPAEVSGDKQLLDLMHHILVANRFWLQLSRSALFDMEGERRVPTSLEELISKYRVTYIEEDSWLGQITDSDLARQLETPYMPGRKFSVEQGIVQVCLHSHGHRAQAAVRLRQLGGTPPVLDFVTWLKDRPAVEWGEVPSSRARRPGDSRQDASAT